MSRREPLAGETQCGECGRIVPRSPGLLVAPCAHVRYQPHRYGPDDKRGTVVLTEPCAGSTTFDVEKASVYQRVAWEDQTMWDDLGDAVLADEQHPAVPDPPYWVGECRHEGMRW